MGEEFNFTRSICLMIINVSRVFQPRKKVVPDIFKDKKFPQGNFKRCREACRDVAAGYTIGSLVEFKSSKFVPNLNSVAKENYANVIIRKFGEWVAHSSSTDSAFKYRIEMVMYGGPLMLLLDHAIRNNNGIASEAVWMQVLPTFLQLRNKNYFT